MRRPTAKKKAKAAKAASNPLERRHQASNPFRRRAPAAALRAEKPYVHVYGNHVICETDTKGYVRPGNRSITEIVVDASDGFIPLWAKNITLRWRFQEQSMSFFEDPAAAKSAISNLLGEALLAWGDA